ncbi:monovalent cation/H+ antiporter complex subunit F [Desulfuribacillus alkaliarsenatis]|uniref:pH regulation protein F n=1 Tax=Desulfuribacillus alkaliarsenatis TaxID=766136 RepID=A0A1E5G443_9FIRM|nr:monovalent cation/H+ antiporter complex subunit F [Desulfuribacillus alkaliarsenatis]OEF97859.1 pH regulation protein F [Desulfuribacillus alkaliarsenatis]
MESLFVVVSIGLVVLILIMLYRVFKGPTVYDRLNGLIVIAADVTILLVLIGYINDRADMFIDIAITYAILGFITFVVLAKYIEIRGSNYD